MFCSLKSINSWKNATSKATYSWEFNSWECCLSTRYAHCLHFQKTRFIYATFCLFTFLNVIYSWKFISKHATFEFYLFMKNIIFKWFTFDSHNLTHFTHFTWILTYIFRNFSTFKHSHIHIMSKIIFENRVFVKILHFTSESVNEAKLLLDIDFEISKKRIYYSTKIINMKLFHCANALICDIKSLICFRSLW